MPRSGNRIPARLTVRLADTVVMMEGGQIIEEGSHEELMSRPTAYRRLYQAQWGSDRMKVNVGAAV